ncbi:MAG: hypothetical protein RO257_17225 [Candidatus Kapabacteria bacterium]|nr:hypothetical protein [Candidatus Kapabacteria bacterium]
MNQPDSRRVWTAKGIPHMRGDEPSVCKSAGLVLMYSPHAWG